MTVKDTKRYVRASADGALRVAESNVLLDSILAAYQQGHSPEAIRAQYSALTLEEIYGAITYSLAHRQEIEDYLKKQAGRWQEWRAKSELACQPLLERLRQAKQSRAAEPR